MGGQNKQGVGIWEEAELIIQGRKEHKQVVIRHKTKICTAVHYFAMKIGCK